MSAMARNRSTPSCFVRSFAGVLLAGLFLNVMGCTRTATETAPPPVLDVTRLDPEEAVRLADSIRQAVVVQVADGLEMTLWAPEQLLADPVALDIDDLGRAYVTRTFRQDNSEFDIRGHRDWMIASIGLQSVEDRRAFLHQTFATEHSEENAWLADLNGDSLHDWRDLAVEKERVSRIEDTSGDGIADFAQVFIEDFHTEVTDVAGAVLAYEDDVFLGVAPDLWRLRDTSGDGMADEKASISHGYAVHIGFSGHGMSGLTVGPDGRIYWSIGDIGFNVVGPDGKTWAYPNQGAVFRANPDGSDFEVFAAGVRNTHEFDFDEYGNLISVDNDGDHPGETERLVYLVEGSDSGWRANWQYGKYIDPDNNSYKVWMDEELYKPRFEGQAAYITPPVASYHSGPAGMAYNPGTALSDAWRNHFFVAEFRGTPARSRIHAFRVREKGATFELADEQVVVDGILATGLDFGPDGALYFADWIDSWGTKDAGRIWKVDVPDTAASPLRAETKALLAEDFAGRSEADLAALLQHADMRIRLKAQFELAERDNAGVATLLAAAQQTNHRLARMHGLWGLGQGVRKGLDVAASLTPFLQDADPEVRAQAAKVIGDVRYAEAADALLALLQDEAARARFFAAEALGRIAYRPAVQPILAMLEANDDADAYLRHAGALALARIGDAESVVALADQPSRALRIAAVVTLRRMGHPGVARFLADEDAFIVTEAARAINDDASIEAALPDLARVLEREAFSNEPLLRRAVNAALRLGTAEYAEGVASFAAREAAPEAMRVEALGALGVWPKPSVLDRVDGVHRGAVERDPAIARAALAPIIEPLLAEGSTPVKVAAAETAGRLAFEPAGPFLFARLQQDRAAAVRTAALEALQAMNYADMEAAVQRALADDDEAVRMVALGMVPELDLPEDRAAALLASVVEQRSVVEQQSALAALGTLQGAHAGAVLAGLFNALEAGTLAAELHLDLLEAAAASASDTLKARVAAYREAGSRGDAVAAYSDALWGGDPDAGRRIFYGHEGAQCARCHTAGRGGGDIGPDLTHVAARSAREQLLQSLVDPGARIAPGFGQVTLTLQNGETVQGLVREEAEAYLVVDLGEGETQRIATETITAQQAAPSSMPPMNLVLNRREIRDVVAFLATLE